MLSCVILSREIKKVFPLSGLTFKSGSILLEKDTDLVALAQTGTPANTQKKGVNPKVHALFFTLPIR